MASLANQTISSTYDGLVKTSTDQPVPISGVQLLEDGVGNSLALSVGRANQGVTITGTATASAFAGPLTGNVTGDLTGSVLTAAQTNITSVGTLSSLAVSGNLTVDTNTLFVDAANNNIGIGTTTATNSRLNIVSSSTIDDVVRWSDGVSDTGYLGIDGTGGVKIWAGGFLSFGAGGSGSFAERMRITSSGNITQTASGNPQFTISGSDGAYTGILQINGAGGGGSKIVATGGTNSLGIDVAGSEAMRIDSSGNVGIGESNPDTKLHVKVADSSVSPRIDLGGTIITEGSTRAGLYILTAGTDSGSYGSIRWGNGNTNTDAAIIVENDTRAMTFTAADAERMRIDSSGVVQVRNQTPTIQLYNTDTSVAASQELGSIDFYTSDISAARVSSYVKSIFDSAFGASYLTFGTSTGVSAPTERMRIDSSGRVGIGTSSPNANLEVAVDNSIGSFVTMRLNAPYYNYWDIKNDSNLSFSRGTSEYMRIDSSGNVGIGESSARNARLLLNNAGSQGAPQLMLVDSGDSGKQSEIRFDSGNLIFDYWSGASRSERMRITSGSQLQITQGDDTYNSGLRLINTSNNHWTLLTGGGEQDLLLAYNASDRGVFDSATGVYTATSDINKKKDIEDSFIGLYEILKLNPSLYRMNNESSDSEKHLGFIAQQVKEFIPQAYKEVQGGDGTFIGLNEMPIIAALTRAIQEQQEIIKDLKARIETLENK